MPGGKDRGGERRPRRRRKKRSGSESGGGDVGGGGGRTRAHQRRRRDGGGVGHGTRGEALATGGEQQAPRRADGAGNHVFSWKPSGGELELRRGGKMRNGGAQ